MVVSVVYIIFISPTNADRSIKPNVILSKKKIPKRKNSKMYLSIKALWSQRRSKKVERVPEPYQRSQISIVKYPKCSSKFSCANTLALRNSTGISRKWQPSKVKAQRQSNIRCITRRNPGLKYRMCPANKYFPPCNWYINKSHESVLRWDHQYNS